MSDSVMLRLTGWSVAQLSAWRLSQRQPAPRHWVDGLRRVLPAELLDGVLARSETTDPVPVGESLSVSFDQLSPDEQRRWRTLSAIEWLSPEERCKLMRGNKKAERAWLSRLCDEACDRAQRRESIQGHLFTDAELDESIPERLKLPAHQRRA